MAMPVHSTGRKTDGESAQWGFLFSGDKNPARADTVGTPYYWTVQLPDLYEKPYIF